MIDCKYVESKYKFPLSRAGFAPEITPYVPKGVTDPWYPGGDKLECDATKSACEFIGRDSTGKEIIFPK